MVFNQVQRLRPWLKRAAVGGGTFALGVVAFPYAEDVYWHQKHPERVWNQEHTERDSELARTSTSPNRSHKKKLVILGTGWASISVLKHIDRDKYDVTIISPRNYFLFTPLLPVSYM